MISYHCCDCNSRELFFDLPLDMHYCHSCDKYVYAVAKRWD